MPVQKRGPLRLAVEKLLLEADRPLSIVEMVGQLGHMVSRASAMRAAHVEDAIGKKHGYYKRNRNPLFRGTYIRIQSAVHNCCYAGTIVRLARGIYGPAERNP